MTWLLATYKYLLSFRKAEWTLDDYPIRLRQQATSVETPAVRAWCAQIVNWWMLAGFGDTPEAALEDLRAHLEAKRSRGDALPRPGTKAPVEFAPGNELGRHGEFAYEFVERVVGIRPHFMSDQTSLADFCTPEEAADVHRKSALLFGIDTRGTFDEPLWKVLDLVQGTDGAN
jgi:hypothetical protein